MTIALGADAFLGHHIRDLCGWTGVPHLWEEVVGDGGLHNCQVLGMQEPLEMAYLNFSLLPVGKPRHRKDGNMARATKAKRASNL